MEDKIENWVSLKEVQEYIGVRRETVLQLIANNCMPAYKVGRLWKFKLSEIDEWIRSGAADDDKQNKNNTKRQRDKETDHG